MSDYTVKAHEDGNNLVLQYYQDVEPVMEAAAAARREEREAGKFDNKRMKSEFRRTMMVPFNVLMEITQKTGLDFFNPGDAKEIMKILKRPEYAQFRTTNTKNL